jgi:hypothetical protein
MKNEAADVNARRDFGNEPFFVNARYRIEVELITLRVLKCAEVGNSYSQKLEYGRREHRSRSLGVEDQ